MLFGDVVSGMTQSRRHDGVVGEGECGMRDDGEQRRRQEEYRTHEREATMGAGTSNGGTMQPTYEEEEAE